MVAARRRFTDGDNRSNCLRAHPSHYSTTMRYVAIRSFVLHVNNTLEPPSPASRENSLESDVPPPDSFTAEPHSSPEPPMIPSVEMPGPKPTFDDRASYEGNRRTKWFGKVITKRSRNRTPRQTPSDACSQSGIPSQTQATPQDEKPSTMSPGKRLAVSVPFSVDAWHGYLTTRLSGRLESPLLDHRLVHVSYPFMNIVTYCPSQKKVTPKPPVSCQPPKTAPRSEAGSANVPDETKAEASGAQNNVEVRVYFARLAPGLSNSFSEKLEDYRRTTLMSHFSFQCRYPHGYVVAVRTISISVERIKRATSICGRQCRYPVFL